MGGSLAQQRFARASFPHADAYENLDSQPAVASGLKDARRAGNVRTVRFFAVGTNMDEELFRNWIDPPFPRRLTIASLSGFTLRWNKRSSEGGKLAPLRTDHLEDVIWGVVYEVDGLAWRQIGEAQRGAGYREERVTVVAPDGGEHDASVYVARPDTIDDSILPMRSYRDPIVNAARANGLPAEYVDALARTPVANS
jgi:AIG2-like family